LKAEALGYTRSISAQSLFQLYAKPVLVWAQFVDVDMYRVANSTVIQMGELEFATQVLQ